MERRRGQSGRLSTCKSSHVISKSNSPVQQITPVIRIVHIFAPKFVNTDAANFRDIVQQLTGKHSCCSPKRLKQKKPNPTLGPQIPLFCKKMVKAEHSVSKTDEEEEDLLSTVLSLCEEQSSSSLTQIMTEEDSANSLESIFGSLGGFGEMDFFTPLVGSTSMLPEFPTTPPPNDQTDHLTGIFMPS